MPIDLFVTIVASVFASTGFWNYLQLKSNKRSKTEDMLLGLAHDRIYELCRKYIKRGYVSQQGFDNLIHLYEPYKHLGGNGTCKELMNKIYGLPMHEQLENKNEK